MIFILTGAVWILFGLVTMLFVYVIQGRPWDSAIDWFMIPLFALLGPIAWVALIISALLE